MIDRIDRQSRKILRSLIKHEYYQRNKSIQNDKDLNDLLPKMSQQFLRSSLVRLLDKRLIQCFEMFDGHFQNINVLPQGEVYFELEKIEILHDVLRGLLFPIIAGAVSAAVVTLILH